MSDVPRRRGAGFRPGQDEPGLPPPPPVAAAPRRAAPSGEMAFSPAAEAGGTDLDVLMGYQIFLGRDPENSFVIADAKTSPIRAFLRALMGSGEFQSGVLDPLMAGRALPHERFASGPPEEQRAWLLRFLDLDAIGQAGLRDATGWRDFLRVLAALPGFPGGERAAAAVPAGVTAEAAGRGFVLISIDQPKPGEPVTAGARIIGSGWAIAPADVTEVAVSIDDTLLTHASYGLPRPDVARGFPHYRHVDHCGFTFAADVPGDMPLTAESQLVVTVRTVLGDVGRKGVRIGRPKEEASRAEDRAAPSWPIRMVVEDASVGASGVLRVRGWAVAEAGIAGVGVCLGDSDLGQAETGVARPDIARDFPGYPGSDRCGFILVRPLAEWRPGPGYVRVQVADTAGRQRQATVPVVLPSRGEAIGGDDGAAEASARSDLCLEIDRPVIEHGVAIAAIRGTVSLSGWTVARGGVDHVAVSCDGVALGRAYLGIRREEIGAAFPDFVGASLAGWALVLPAGTLASGTHRITVEAHARAHSKGAGGGSTSTGFTLTVAEPDEAGLGFAVRERMKPAEAVSGLGMLERRGWQPAFTVVIRAEGARRVDLIRTLESLGRQVYPGWRAMVLVSGEAAAGALAAAARTMPGWDAAMAARIRAVPPGRARDGRVAQAGAASFALVLRAGDVLGCDALLELAIAGAASPGCDMIGFDDVRTDAAQGGRRVFAKPAFSPEYLLSTNYLGRAWCAAASVLEAAGLGLSALAGACDLETVLRVSEQAGRIVHAGHVLLSHHEGGDTAEHEARALEDAMARRGLPARVSPGATAGTWRVAREAPAGTKISIVMPTCGARSLVRRAIETIRATTVAGGYAVEIVVVDNVPATDPALKAWLREAADAVVDAQGAFNWSAFNNLGAAAATGSLLLFLNDDIEAPEPGWLEVLAGHAAAPGVGVVGARLLYPDGKVQHAGQYLADGHARHAFRFAEASSPGPFGLAAAAREIVSVTGACLMTPRAVFDALGGFDEAHSVVNNDLDYCLRAWRDGFSVVYTPHATLVHHELASRAALLDRYDEKRFTGAWRTTFLAGDPYRSARLRADDDHYGLEAEPPVSLHSGRRGPKVSEIRRILAVKLDHIGDFLTSLPALRSLRTRFPDARIDLLAPPASAGLAREASAADEVIEFTFFHARSGQGAREVTAPEFEALAARLGPRRYDMAIDLRMQPETRAVLPCSGAAFLVGYDHGNAFPWLDVALEWEGDLRLAPKRGHISERLVQLVAAAAEACGDDPAPAPPPRLKPGQVPALASLPRAFRSRPLVCVHPGVGNLVRQWPAASFAGLVDLLVDELGVHVVLVGALEEAPVAEEVLRRRAGHEGVESLVGRVGLSELGRVMRACVLFVGNNSGPKHLAASLGVPTIGVHSGVVDATEWGPLGRQAVALQKRMVCGPCYVEFASDCPRGLACLTGIRPRDVFDLCKRMLTPA